MGCEDVPAMPTDSLAESGSGGRPIPTGERGIMMTNGRTTPTREQVRFDDTTYVTIDY